MIWAKSPEILKSLFPGLIWEIATTENVVYLTFDDGPTPTVTDKVLDILKHHNAKGTFFCVGKNVKNHKRLFDRITKENHAVGNHTYDHHKGWSTTNRLYLKNIQKCKTLIETNMFRPPYGRIKRSQIRAIRKKYHIVMWDVLSYDFSPNVNAKQCVKNVLDNVKPGSIVVFHDSIKAKSNILEALPVVLEELSKKGFSFKCLNFSQNS